MNKKKKNVKIEYPPMVTHWKPTGHNCYRVDMKATVIRPRLANKPIALHDPPNFVGTVSLLPQLPRLGIADLLPPEPRPSKMSNSPVILKPVSSVAASVWSTTSPRSDMWRPKCASPSSLDSREIVREMQQQNLACSQCKSGRCCMRDSSSTLRSCIPECPCLLVLAWHRQPDSSAHASPRVSYTPDPEYVRAWRDVPRKCDPQVWVNARRLARSRLSTADKTGANFRFMGWSYVPDFNTAQSCYG